MRLMLEAFKLATKYPPEQIFEIDWNGPYTFEQLKEYDADDPGFTNSLSLYAKYQDHPLYGRKSLTYIGKAIEQSVVKRLSQHDLYTETLYVGTIYPFKSWELSETNYKKSYESQYYVRHKEGDAEIISRVEELLIYALWPAGNSKNKKTAANSWGYRIFNTGHLGDLPPEVSGHYALENAPKPEIEDE